MSRKEINPPRVALVDDDPSMREALSSLIRSTGCQCSVFTSAETFLASGGLWSADCLVLDVQMRGMSGLDLQVRIRELKPAIPIIYVTATPDDYVRDHALRHGAVAVLGKPMMSDALVHTIRDAVGGRGGAE